MVGAFPRLEQFDADDLFMVGADYGWSIFMLGAFRNSVSYLWLEHPGRKVWSKFLVGTKSGLEYFDDAPTINLLQTGFSSNQKRPINFRARSEDEYSSVEIILRQVGFKVSSRTFDASVPSVAWAKVEAKVGKREPDSSLNTA